MQVYPQPTSAVLTAGQVVLTFNLIHCFDGTVLATGLTATAAPGDLAALGSALRNAESAWLVANVFNGDPVAALNAAIANYTPDQWRVWGF
jgi:hypothetical protein